MEWAPSEQTEMDLKTQKVQKTINKGGIILREVADTLIKIKHNKDMTASDMKNAALNSNAHRWTDLPGTW